MGLYPSTCPVCGKPYIWFSGGPQGCAECRAVPAPPIATNTGWPHEKKLHERIAELERERDEALNKAKIQDDANDFLTAKQEEMIKHNLSLVIRRQEIEAERDRLRAALERIAGKTIDVDVYGLQEIAREALAPCTGRNPSDSEIAGPRE